MLLEQHCQQPVKHETYMYCATKHIHVYADLSQFFPVCTFNQDIQ